MDLFGLKKKPTPTSETDFYAVVSALAQFIERVDQGQDRETLTPQLFEKS